MKCAVCPRLCDLEEGETGFCNVRQNVNGENVDSLLNCFYPFPERFNDFAPGSYTVVFPGCNLKCWFCNVPFVSGGFNGDISKWPGQAYRRLLPHELIEKVKAKTGPDRAGFTCGLMGLFGGEPTIHPEYILEAGRLCHEAGCASKLHTNGYINEDTFRKIIRSVNIVSVNAKASCSPRAYQRMSATPDPVLHSIDVAWQAPNIDGKTRDTKTVVVRNTIPHDLAPTEEETARFGDWLVAKTDPFIEVLVEPTAAAKDHFTDRRVELEQIPPGDDLTRMIRRIWSIGETLFDCGLENVWVLISDLGQIHCPTGRNRGSDQTPENLAKILNNMAKTYNR